MRAACLNEAAAQVCSEKEEEYGDPHVLYGLVGQDWGCEPYEAALRQAQQEIRRLMVGQGRTMKNFAAAAGYIALAAELCLGKEVEDAAGRS